MKATGIIKILIIVFNAISIFALPWPLEPEGLLISPAIPFILVSTFIPAYYLIIRKVRRENLKWPRWNTNLFDPKGQPPFGNVDFFGALFTIIGLTMSVSNKLNYNVGSKVGFTSLSFGLGILFGLFLTIILGRRTKSIKFDN